jgi:putative metal-binding protein
MSCHSRGELYQCTLADSRPSAAAIHAGSELPSRGALLWKALVMGLFLFVVAAPPVTALQCQTNADCNDNNSCTSDTCINGTCSTGNINQGLACVSACVVGAGTCSNGKCTGTFQPKDTPCNDGNACTANDMCNPQGMCVSGPALVCTALDQCHVAGTCQPSTGVCSNPTKANGAACTANADSCADACQAGVCVAAPPPTAEVCNGVDDNCNGTVDEGTSGAATSCGVGACASTGMTTCVNGIPGDTCTPGQPTAEICNGIDDNCNGMADEGTFGAVTSCGVGACASVGVTTCLNGSPGDTCIAGQPTAETCNGIDDNCDGTVDEGTSGAATTCGVGACASTGMTTCANGIPGDTCTPGQPTAETCNGVDDNCNGTVDDGTAGTPTTCGTGACASTGVTTCTSGIPGDSCTPGQPTGETCNGLDDDCDGTVDEGTTSCGTGACGTTVPMCVNGQDNACTPGTPGTEVCNGVDDDCDGQVDESGCKVTGGGQLVEGGPWVSFGFNVQKPPIKGQLEYHNHTDKTAYHSITIDDLMVTLFTCPNGDEGRQATFTGDLRRKGQAGTCRFQVEVTDCGEPGTQDTLSFVPLSGDCPAPRSGPLDRGNIQVH